MIVRDLEYNFEPDPQHSAGRSSGLHLGQCIQAYGVQAGLLKVTTNDSGKWLQFEKGFLWEEFFSAVWGERMASRSDNLLMSQVEMERDGIFMTPDAVDFDDQILWEFKSTTKSMAKFDQLEVHFALWLMQIKGYLYGLGMNRCNLIVLFLCGDYKPPFPHIKAKQLEFTDRELVENWAIVQNYARWIRNGGGK